jgi:hypothetical protein
MTKRRNMTITVDEDVARWARMKAASEDTSVAHLVGELLRLHMREEDEYEAAMKEHFAQEAKPLRTRGRYPRRDEIHER